MSPKTEDLKPVGFPDLDWSPKSVRDSLSKLRGYTEDQANKANDWYLQKRVSKKFAGRALRIFAILMTAAAGLVPVASQLWQADGKPIIAPGYSPLFLGLAGLLILLDKFLGCTNAWLRYLSASQKIGNLLRTFRFDWEAELAAIGMKDLTTEQVQQMISRCRSLVVDVDRVVSEETQAWVNEFKTILKQVDQAAREAPKQAPLGGIDVEVTNGDQVTGNWNLKIDGGVLKPHSGKTASISGIAPGIHNIIASGVIGGSLKQAEQNIEVSGGAIESISLTLG